MRGTVIPILMVLLGFALIVRTLAAGVTGAAYGLVVGVLLIAAGVGRLYLERRR